MAKTQDDEYHRPDTSASAEAPNASTASPNPDCCHPGHHHEADGEHCSHHDHHHDDDGHEGHHHHHHHHHETIGQQARHIALSTLLLIGAVLVERLVPGLTPWQLLGVYLIPYLTAGLGTLRTAAAGIAHGDMLDEHFLMSVATIGALCIGLLPGAEAQLPEAVFVMLFFQVGELAESYAEHRSHQSIAQLMDLRPDTAEVEHAGATATIAATELKVGDVIIVRPGGKVPTDGTLIAGQAVVDVVALTGESLPREVPAGGEMLAGSVNLAGPIRLRATKAFGESTAAGILRLVESAADHKSRSEAFITRFARVYTPIVVGAAVVVALLPPLLLPGTFTSLFPTWLYRGLMFLIVSCPCALVLSVPLTIFGGIGHAARRGILIKGGSYVDALAATRTVVFDKTGTLTAGRFSVTDVRPAAASADTLLAMAAAAETYSTHPIAAALRAAHGADGGPAPKPDDVAERAGLGVAATIDGHRVAVGAERMMEAEGVACTAPADAHGTIVHVAIDRRYAGCIVVGDQPKADSHEAIAQLHELGIGRTVMLTGDRAETAGDVARRLGIDEWHAGLLPADKVQTLSQLADAMAGSGATLAFVGDGINDAPVLKRADVGIAMGALGSDAAIEAADVVLMDDRPTGVATAIRISRRTLAIARQNVILAIGIKVAVLLLAALGLAGMPLAVFADVGVTVIATANALRALGPVLPLHRKPAPERAAL